jgi:hypothetical protein
MGGYFPREALDLSRFAADLRSLGGVIQGSSVFWLSPIRRGSFNHT